MAKIKTPYVLVFDLLSCLILRCVCSVTLKFASEIFSVLERLMRTCCKLSGLLWAGRRSNMQVNTQSVCVVVTS